MTIAPTMTMVLVLRTRHRRRRRRRLVGAHSPIPSGNIIQLLPALMEDPELEVAVLVVTTIIVIMRGCCR